MREAASSDEQRKGCDMLAKQGEMGVEDSEGFWTRVLSLTRKEIRQLLRDQSNLAIGIGLPIALILIFGYGLSLDVTECAGGGGAGRPFAHGCRCRRGAGALRIHIAQ